MIVVQKLRSLQYNVHIMKTSRKAIDMQATFDIDINDYMSDEEIRAMILDEVRYKISDKVDKALRYVSVSDIIYSVASKTAIRLLEENDVDLHQKIANKVLESIDDLSLYDVRDDDNGNKSKGQLVLDECVEEAKPKIQQKIDEIIEDRLNADWLIDSILDDFYGRLRDQLIGKK